MFCALGTMQMLLPFVLMSIKFKNGKPHLKNTSKQNYLIKFLVERKSAGAFNI